MSRNFSFLWFLLTAVGLLACSSPGNEEHLALQGQALQQKGQDLFCGLQRLGAESQSLWDSVAFSLEQQLPRDMPAKERKNMVEVRNAGLIRMFEAFPKLPPEVQQSVAKAEQEDQQIASRMRALNDSLKEHDRLVGQYLETVKAQLPHSLLQWQSRLASYPCD